MFEDLASLTETLKGKINIFTLAFVAAGVVAIAYVVLGASLLEQRSRQDDTSSQLDAAQQVLVTADSMAQDLDALPGRLEALEQELAAAEAAFPSEVNTDATLKMIVGHAAQTQVRLLNLSAQPPADLADEAPAQDPAQQPGGTAVFSQAGIMLEAEGGFANLIAFLAAIEQEQSGATKVGAFSLTEHEGRYTLSVELLTFSRTIPTPTPVPSPPPDAEQVGDGDSPPDAEVAGESVEPVAAEGPE